MNWPGFTRFCERVDAGAPYAELRAMILAEPRAKLRRACAVHLARLEREVASDDELRELATHFAGKVPRYIDAALLVRRLRRDPHDAEALAAARAVKQAWVDRFLATLAAA